MKSDNKYREVRVIGGPAAGKTVRIASNNRFIYWPCEGDSTPAVDRSIYKIEKFSFGKDICYYALPTDSGIQDAFDEMWVVYSRNVQ